MVENLVQIDDDINFSFMKGITRVHGAHSSSVKELFCTLVILEFRFYIAVEYTSLCSLRNVDYFNARGSFLDDHTVQATSHDGEKVCHSR